MFKVLLIKKNISSRHAETILNQAYPAYRRQAAGRQVQDDDGVNFISLCLRKIVSVP